MTVLEFTLPPNTVAYTGIPADSTPSDELAAMLELFWLTGARISWDAIEDTYGILIDARTPFEVAREWRVRIVEVGQGQS